MAVISTPVSARARITYVQNVPNARIGGLNPDVDSLQFAQLVGAYTMFHGNNVLMEDAFLTVESDLTSN